MTRLCIYSGSGNRLLLNHLIPKAITKGDRFSSRRCAYATTHNPENLSAIDFEQMPLN
ncbi:hypothetical protein [Nostoc sp.]|uniref:hypothetical protein n=1 Tax=Nostoc sp. TaxID=1180 RepID=UPI002FFC4521